MRTLELSPLKNDGFSLDARVESQGLVVRFSGNGDMAAVPALGRYLKLVHQEARALSVSLVSFDFSDLYFMNSSCFKAFVTFIDNAGKIDPVAYGIRFLTNPKLHWQRRSLEALRYLAPGLVRVEPIKAGA